jgi:hypothetical protein
MIENLRGASGGTSGYHDPRGIQMIRCDQNAFNLIRSPDEMTSNGSTSVYSEDELRKLIHFVKQIKVIGGKDGYSACMVG